MARNAAGVDRREDRSAESSLSQWLSVVPAMLTFTGVMLYSVIYFAYSFFYDRLGISPSDVGLGYLEVLSSSPVLVIIVAVTAIVLVSRYIRRRLAIRAGGIVRDLQDAQTRDERARRKSEAEQAAAEATSGGSFLEEVKEKIPGPLSDEQLKLIERVERHRREGQQAVERTMKAFQAAQAGDKDLRDALNAVNEVSELGNRDQRVVRSSLALGVLIALLLALIPLLTLPKARDGHEGRPVGPIRVLGFTVLDVHADTVTLLSPTGSARGTGVDVLQGRSLLYLGNAKGLFVLYDREHKQALFVPSSAAVLRLERS